MFFFIYNCLHVVQTLKIDKNKYADKRQYEAYKKVLKNNPYMPKKLEDFINIKYNDVKEYTRLKVRYHIKTRANLKVHQGKQAKHLLGHNNYQQGSYVYAHVDIQKLVNTYATTGDIKLSKKGDWANKEFIKIDSPVGVYISKDKTVQYETTRFAIHYSKKGTHIVQRKEI